MIAAAIGPIFTFLDTALKRAFPDKTERDRIQGEIEKAILAADVTALQGQLAINAEEAKSENAFVAGWRPFIGWTCGSAFAWHFVVQPFCVFGASVAGVELPPLPALDSATLMPVLMGMLGLGGLRSLEKVQAANKRR
jgi:hypothetical protein